MKDSERSFHGFGDISAGALHKFFYPGFLEHFKTSGQLILFNKWRNKIL